MATTYPYGYGSTRLTLDQLMSRTTVSRLHPEFRRRVFALMEAAAAEGVPLGIGTGWRIQPNPPPPGFAKPGNSNHESFPAGSNTPTAVAADMVPTGSWPWMERNVARFGLRTFKYVNSEPWHIQPSEIPASRNRRTTPWTLNPWPLPGGGKTPDAKPAPQPTPAPGSAYPAPTLRQGNTGTEVYKLINVLKWHKWYPAQYMDDTNDSKFGSRALAGVKAMQREFGLAQTGVYDDAALNALKIKDGVIKPPAPTPAPSTTKEVTVNVNLEVLREGARSKDARRCQALLNARAGRTVLELDGHYGPKTAAVVRLVQSEERLAVDGICGAATWTALLER